MRTLMLLALPLLFVACDEKKEEPKMAPHQMDPAPSADKAKDVVCGMFVEKAKATKLTHEGADYYFCSDKCVESFKKEPKKYASHCACANSKKQCACDHCGGKEPCDCVN